jgi:hypothetical protein
MSNFITCLVSHAYEFTAVLSTPKPSFHYGGSFLSEAVQAFQQKKKAAGSPRDELVQYLESEAETTTNVIAWWGVCISSTFLRTISNKVNRTRATPSTLH